MPVFSGLLFFALLFMGCRNVWPDGILFYQGIACSIASSLVPILSAMRPGYRLDLSQAKDAALVFFISYSFMFTVPTTVERSYTVKMLEELHRRGSMSEPEMLRWIEAHWRTSAGLTKRLHEQELSGSISRSQSTLRLTGRGILLVKSFQTSALLFKTGGKDE